jgi:acyl-CoA reductase-like NAD-dependent aldehyde dehydrogenase
MVREIPVRNPRTGEADYTIVPLARAALAQACDRLRVGQKSWGGLPIEGRVAVLQDFKSALDNHRDEILTALCADTGRHPLSVMEFEALKGIIDERCEQCGTVLAGTGGTSASDPEVSFVQQYVPYGLAAVISPWNYPLVLGLLDAIPGLLAGCAIAVKPSEVTPRFIQPLRRAIADVPALYAVLEVFAGDGETGSALVDLADTVVFTGSVRTGRRVLEQAARQFKLPFLELGGKDPAIVLGSADVAQSAEIVLRGALENAGQLCCSVERVYVHDSLAEDFSSEICRQASELSFNHPDIDRGEIGPLIFEKQADIIRSHLDDAQTKGARVLVGGNIIELDGGLWCEPTVVVNVNHDMDLMREETFGPIVPIMSFASPEEAIRLANDSEYGLSAMIIGAEDEARTLARSLNAGGVWINDFDTMGLVGDVAEKNAFNCSGLGGSRYGQGGLLRFVRKKAIVMRSSGH